MTLLFGWIRRVGRSEELLLASDSRLRSEGAWDCCPKLFALPRGDSALGFAGATEEAYPLALQIQNAMSLHRGSLDRSHDLLDAKGHVIRVFREMREYIGDLPVGRVDPPDSEASFLLGGFSWRARAFGLWKLTYNPGMKVFEHHRCRAWTDLGKDRVCAIVGNPSMGPAAAKRAKERGEEVLAPGADVAIEARKRLVALLDRRGIRDGIGFDMEPFEILRDMIREGASPYVGGAPQLVKVYAHMNARPIAVRWPDARADKVAVLGRPLLDYERLDCPILDPDSLAIEPAYRPSI